MTLFFTMVGLPCAYSLIFSLPSMLSWAHLGRIEQTPTLLAGTETGTMGIDRGGSGPPEEAKQDNDCQNNVTMCRETPTKLCGKH